MILSQFRVQKKHKIKGTPFSISLVCVLWFYPNSGCKKKT